MKQGGGTRGGRWEAARNTINGSLWPVPTLAVMLSLGLAIGLPELDQVLQQGDEPLALVFTGGPSAARTVLSAIASSLISVTTLLFSLTIVTLQLASSQYSPRLLQTFVRDRVVQICLGVLLGTFVYALVVLRTVRSADESDEGAFVPRLSVTVAVALALASVGALVLFLSHQTRQLRVETMMRDVHTEATGTLQRISSRADADDQPDAPLPAVPERARPVCARHSGFYVQLGEAPLLRLLSERGLVLQLVRRPGEPVIEGAPLAWAWTDDPTADVPVEELEKTLEKHLTVSAERQDAVDPGYGLRKLVDIAARALSPGINDPTTAVHAMSHVSDLLGRLTERDAWHRRLADDAGRVRLLVMSWDFPALLDLALTQPRHYGSEDPTVVERLFVMLAETAWRSRTPGQRAAVAHQRDQLVEQSHESPPAGRSLEQIDAWAAAVDAALAGRWPRPGE